MNKFRLTVTFPLVVRTMIEDTKEVERLVGRDCFGAGSGFGGRDVEFDFPTNKERAAAVKRLMDAPTVYDIQTFNDADEG